MVAPLLFCEGTSSSLDIRLLSRLLASNVIATAPRLRPAGGKKGIASFVDGVLSGYDQPPQYLVLRDRDLDQFPPGVPALIAWKPRGKPTKRPIYLLYRACIENYLISPKLVHDFWSLPGMTSRHGRSPGEGLIGDMLLEADTEIAAYQAVRWALTATLATTEFPQVRDKLTDKSGVLPSTLNFESCLSQAEAMVVHFQESAAAFDIHQLRRLADEYKQQFAASEFYATGQHMVWFHGKDLCTSLLNKLPWSDNEFKRYLSWAVDEVDPLAFPDLVEWQQKVAGL